GEFEAALVGLVDGGLELGARDVHVGLEAGDALVGPEVDGGLCVGGVFELVHLEGEGAGAFEVGAGDVDVRAGDAAVVDGAAEVEVEIGLDGAGGAEGGDAGAEVETRRGEGHLGHDDGRLGGAGDVEVGAGEVVHVVVHADEAGEDGVAGEVDVQRGRAVGAGPGGHVAFVGLHVIGREDSGDFAVREDDGGVFERSGTGAVDDADVVEPEGVLRVVVLDVAGDG